MPSRNTALNSILRLLLLALSLGIACTANVRADAPAALREKYASLGDRLSQSPFRRPLVIDSNETQDRVEGDIHGVIDFPFAAVNAGLNSPDHWCDVMILHINTKYCRATKATSGTALRVHIGKKTPEALTLSDGVDFGYRVAAASPEYLEILLNASQGPMGTSDYRIRLQAVALPNARTFLHLSYSYVTNLAGRLALDAYLLTIGSNKVGFTMTGTQANGQPEFIGGTRGVVERNAMRYYLAIDSYLQAEDSPPAQRLENRLQAWFTAVEKYPRQLHEIDRAAYLEMKHAEVARQQAPD
jgi:hypothetical protein